MHVEDMRVNWMPFHLLGERFDCIFNVGGYKHDRMSSQASIAATVTLVCQNSFEVSNYPFLSMGEILKHNSHVATQTWSPV